MRRLAVALAVVACGPDDAPEAPPPNAEDIAVPTVPRLDENGLLTLDSLGVLATYGMNETSGPEAILQKPMDATFLGEDVLVLDASAPWVRRFERGGRFDSAMVRQGEGPGEASRPYALAATEDGFLLSHSRGIERFGTQGELLASMRADRTLRGALECDGALIVTGEVMEEGFITTRSLARLGPDGLATDTFAVFRPARHTTRDLWTWFAYARDGTLLYYTEEETRSRLERRSCSGEMLGEIVLDSIGPGLAIRGDQTRIQVRSPLSPHPAGLARVLDRTLWATRHVTAESDSITMIEAFDAAGAKRRLALDGWYQLFDADAEGRLLVGNTWTLGQNWIYGAATGDIPAVYLLEGRALLAAIDAYGTP
jgi:hypothetical protein